METVAADLANPEEGSWLLLTAGDGKRKKWDNTLRQPLQITRFPPHFPGKPLFLPGHFGIVGTSSMI